MNLKKRCGWCGILLERTIRKGCQSCPQYISPKGKKVHFCAIACMMSYLDNQYPMARVVRDYLQGKRPFTVS